MNGDMISRSALLKNIDGCKAYVGFPMATKIIALELVTYEPAVDAEPVVHAHWVGDPGDWHCSHCGAFAPDGGFEQTKRCPNCGAHMDEEVEE